MRRQALNQRQNPPRFVEGLEPRLLMRGSAFHTTRINFQPAGAPVPAFCKADIGAKYGLRANGMTYGWSGTVTVNAVDRNNPLSPDQRYDTLIDMQKGGSFMWSLAVPKGVYTVRVVAGDPGFLGHAYKINVEGIRTVTGIPTSSNHWVEGTSTVTVSDGKLTISNGKGAENNRINFIEIAPGRQPLPVVSVAASGKPGEGGGTGTFTFTRTGNLSSPLTVNYTLGGAAGNGVDYNALTGAVTIPAGSAFATLALKPIDDSAVEPGESVVLTLSASSVYSTGQIAKADRTIADNDVSTPALGKLTWTRVANSPVARSEAQTATVDGKVYVFGGFSDSSFTQGTRADVYNAAANKWSRIADMPRAITHAGAAVDGSTVWLAGGYAQDPGNSAGGKKTFGITDVWKYDTSADKWTKGPSLPAARAAGGLAKFGNFLYYFGGEDAKRAMDVADTFRLDLNHQSAGWTKVASMPAPRNHAGVVTLGAFIYVAGGQLEFDNNSEFKNSLYRYDPANNTWKTLANLPAPASHISNSTVVYKGQLITIGGQGAGEAAIDTVSAFNPSTGKWSVLQPLPGKRLSGAGASLGDKIFFTSGYSGVFNNQSYIGTFS